LGNASNLRIPFVFSMVTFRFTGTLTPENLSTVNNNYMVMKNGQIALINFFRKNCAMRIKINVKVTVFYTVSPSVLTVLAEAESTKTACMVWFRVRLGGSSLLPALK